MDSHVRGNIELLRQAQQLLSELSDEQYQSNEVPPFNSGVGKHVRHVLDFYAALLNRKDNKINYDARGRDQTVEARRGVAKERIDQICKALGELKDFDAAAWSKNDEAIQTPSDQGFQRSTIGRELQFLVNHTVHHFAVIAILLHSQGFATPRGFGVAISTLAHWSQAGKEPSC